MIKIGTCVKGEEIVSVLPDIINSGYESVEIYFETGLKDTDLKELAKKTNEIIKDSGVEIASIGIYVNPLQYESQCKEVEECIDNANLFGAPSLTVYKK